jgi:L-aspartate oxidase
MSWQARADVVVIGTGVAGLAAALAASRQGRSVMVLSKAGNTATFYAQGGIAVVLPRTEDSIDAHVNDTLLAGAGLCDADAVRSIVADGYRAVVELCSAGAHFDEDAFGRWALTREGGHSRRRIIHAGGDATGAEVQRALDRAAARSDIRRNHVARQLLFDADGITGVEVINDDDVGVVHSPVVILATGGLGHLYQATTNPEGSTGDGIALALWAGATVSDIEFVQFHPTMLFDGRSGRRPLISEALRGEGAKLVDRHGDSVTAGAHPLGDLAPRDVVAAAIRERLRHNGDRCVYLDARAVTDVARRFPTVTAACRAAGIDLTRELIPVVPGAHYSCGGVLTDVDGRTEVAGLFAAGEVARTGMHGANRLASNSLLEGLVVGARAGRAAAAHAGTRGRVTAVTSAPVARNLLSRNELQRVMTSYVSVTRGGAGVARAQQELSSAPVRVPRTRDDSDDIALTQTALAVVAAASARTESRGCHHRSDHPEPDPAQVRSSTVRMGADGQITVDVPLSVGACP